MRLYYEPLTVEHADLIYSYTLDDDLYRFIPDVKYPEREGLRQRFRQLAKGSGTLEEVWVNWVVFDDTSQQQPIGTLQATISLISKLLTLAISFLRISGIKVMQLKP